MLLVQKECGHDFGNIRIPYDVEEAGVASNFLHCSFPARRKDVVLCKLSESFGQHVEVYDRRSYT